MTVPVIVPVPGMWICAEAENAVAMASIPATSHFYDLSIIPPIFIAYCKITGNPENLPNYSEHY